MVSSVQFCFVFTLRQLYESGVGCYIGHVYAGALAYADDVVLLAPTPAALRIMLDL